MGNANNKPLTSQHYSKLTVDSVVEQLREDITCSICLDVLEDPVSIECGHNFCRRCLSAHWRGVSALGYQCPECRAPCSKNRMTSDTRVKNVVEKIRDLPREEMPKESWRASSEEGPEVQQDLGHPVQLVHLDKEGKLILDEEVLSHCLEQGGVGDAPVCLLSIIGEQRKGKSFLMNYLLRRLQNMDVTDGSWMGREDEPLKGFVSQVGIHGVTKGLWAWSKPFWVPVKGRKVAVLLVDTEGSLNITGQMETNVKLSALSMMLGSYQILNISSQLKDTDLQYLEMFLQVAEVVGEEYGLKPIQHLDVLVRDWCCSQDFGDIGGKEYLRDVRQMLEETSSDKYPRVLDVLSRHSIRCYLMPFPGKQIMRGSQGRLRDMDEDFQESLREYVDSLVGSAGQYVHSDQNGELLTGTQLTARIKKFADLLKNHHFGFSSPSKMATVFHNQRVIERIRTDHSVFLKEKDGDSRNMTDCLKVKPSKMVKLLAERREQLLWRCQTDLQTPALKEEDLLTELEVELIQEDEKFLETYRKRFKKFAIVAGVSVGALALASVGAAGAGIAAAAIAAEAMVLGVTEAVAIGAATGGVTGICAGGGVGGIIARKDKEQAKTAGGRKENGDSMDDLSDDTPLI